MRQIEYSDKIALAANQKTKERDYWTNQLAGDFAKTNFPYDAEKKDDSKIHGQMAEVNAQCSSHLLEKLMKLSNGIDIKLHMILVAGLVALLYKYTDSKDIVTGASIVKQKTQAQFINTILVYRNRVQDTMCFKDLLLQVRETIIKDAENQNYPLEYLANRLNLPAVQGEFSLFDVVLLLENIHDEKYLEGIDYHVLFSFLTTGMSIQVRVRYQTALYMKQTIERIITHFMTLLDQATTNADMVLSSVDLLSGEEKQQLLEEFNNSILDYPRDKTIDELFREQAAKTPHHTALVGIHQTHQKHKKNDNRSHMSHMSYKKLNEKSRRLAYLLKEKGVKPNTIVAVMVERSIEMIVSVLAVIKAGGAYLPLDPAYPPERIDFMIKDSQTPLLITQEHLCDRVNIGEHCKIIDINHEDYSTGNSADLAPLNRAADLVYVIYTSGSTGKPKGVLVQHRHFVNAAFAWRKEYYLEEMTVRLLQMAPFSFDVFAGDLARVLLNSGKMVITPRSGMDPEALYLLITRHEITLFESTPGYLVPFMAYVYDNGLEIPSLKLLILGSDSCRVEDFKVLLARFGQRMRIINSYGVTEATIDSSYYEGSLEYPISSGNVPIGKVLPNMRFYILNPRGMLQPIGVAGELCIGGAGVARGYLNNPELTAEKFDHDEINKSFCGGPGGSFFKKRPLAVGDKVYKTGDQARWLADGNVEFLGRIDSQIKVRGFRIELGEIENRLMAHPDIKEAAVVQKTTENNDKYLCGYIISHKNLDPEELRQFLGQKLPDYMVPWFYVQIDCFPLTPNGKIDRKALPEPETTSQVEYVAPRNQSEEKLLALWSDVLGKEKEQIGIDTNFFDLGGNSLKAVVLISKMHKELDIKLQMIDIFKLQTIRAISASVQEAPQEKFISIEPTEKKEYYALSSAQKRLYFLQQLDRNNTTYNMPMLLPLGKDVDRSKIETTLKKLISRHESLRTSFERVDKEPVQRIHDEVRFEIEYYNSGRQGNRETGDEFFKAFIRPFDLSQAPLMRSGLIRVSYGQHIWMVDMHHIISDGTSHTILSEDFLALYSGKELEPLRLHYKDFSQWQNGLFENDEIKGQEDYWLELFSGEIPRLELPTDFKRPEVFTFEGAGYGFMLEKEVALAFKALGKKNGATLYMNILAVLNTLFYKYTGQVDIIIGSVIAGRPHADLQQIIGMFVNTLAMRNSPDGEKTYESFLKLVVNNSLEAIENQDVQFEELVEKLNLERDLSRNPLFDITMVVQNVRKLGEGGRENENDLQLEVLPLTGESFSGIDYKATTAKFDITFLVHELEGNIFVSVEYYTAVFKEETLRRLEIHFKNVIKAVTADPLVKLRDIEIITREEKEEILDTFNNTARDYPRQKTIHRLFAEQVEKTPDQVALIGVHETHEKHKKNYNMSYMSYSSYLSYKELNKKSQRLAYLLQEKGVRPDTIVISMVERGIEMAIGLLGILKAGGAYLPIDPDYPEERKHYMLAESGAKILVSMACEVIDINDIVKDIKSSPTHPLTHSPTQLNLAYVLYTSGTTGQPKGVMVEHQNVVRLVKNTDYVEFQPRDRILQTGAVDFDASTFEIWGSLLNGLTLCLTPKEEIISARHLKENLRKYHITILWLTSPLFNQMVEADVEIFSGLRHFLVGGDVLSPYHINHLKQRYPGLKVTNGYGPTENTTFSATLLIDKEYHEAIPIGKPIANSRVYIVDNDGHIQPVGIPGEILVGGDGTARGYLNNPELTAEKFLATNQKLLRGVQRGGFLEKSPSGRRRLYKSGDQGRWLPDGTIEFLGRIDTQVKIRGFRIELEEIENRLLKHRDIKETVVIAKEGENRDKYLCAYIVANKALTGPDIREFLARQLPGYMIPSFYVHLDKLPLTPSGKIAQNTLPSPEIKPEPGYIPPRDEIERKLVGIWSGVLGLKREVISINSNFFQLGGHSLSATILSSQIHKTLNVKMPLVEIFKCQTIKELSQWIRDAGESKYAGITPVEKKEYYDLSSAQKRLYFLQQTDSTGIGYNMPLVLPLGKDVEKDKLEITLKKLILRHENLRTSFELVNEEPVQRIHDEVEFEIEYYDSGRQASREIGNEYSQRTPLSLSPSLPEFFKAFIRPFDLSRAPLLRSRFIKHADGNHTWMVDLHHIISDGTSHTILTEDFLALYSGKELEPLRLHYKDFSQWQNRLFASGEIKGQEDYWLEMFSGDIPRLELPTDFKRPEVFTFEGNNYGFMLEREDALAFKALGNNYGATLYMNILTVLNALFFKYTGQTDIIIGSGVAGRLHADLHSVIGMFVNTLVMRNTPEAKKDYASFLKEVISVSIDAFENQDVQFEELVEKLNLERDPSRNPLFDISMVVQNFREAGKGGIDKENLSQIEVLPLADENFPAVDYMNPTTKFDMTFFLHEIGDDVYVNIEYYTGIFKPETIQRVAVHFRHVIKAVIGNPLLKLKDLDIIPQEEKRQLLYEWNDTAQSYLFDKPLHELFEDQVEQTPDHIVLVLRHSAVTYRELHKKVNQLANYLSLGKKIRQDDRVGILMENNIHLVTGILGVLKAGGAYVPLDPGSPEKRIKTIIIDAAISVIISQKKYIKPLNRLQWECPCFRTFLCMDSTHALLEEEAEESELMAEELWNYVGETATDDITGGGWLSSYTGEPFSREEMDEYGDNILKKLQPLLHKNMRVLEIGIASGITMYRLAPLVDSYHGTDISHVIIEKNREKLKQEEYKNIKLSCLAAHEIDKLREEEFDLIIINSVIQCFHGHNYLRKVIRKCVDLLAEEGYLFLGDIMDQEKKDALAREMMAFKNSPIVRENQYTTKTDFSSELFLARAFWRDIGAEIKAIKSVQCSEKIYTIENELTKFRYDVLINVNKRKSRGGGKKKGWVKMKYQDDTGVLQRFECEGVSRRVSPGSLAYIIYTSGSTGEPKGVAVGHRGVVNMLTYRKAVYRMNPGFVALQLFSYCFDGFVTGCFTPIISGAKLVLLAKEEVSDIEKIKKAIVNHGVTHFICVPTLYATLIELLAKQDLLTLKAVTLAGERVGLNLVECTVEKSKTLEIVNEYGVTEASVMSSIYRHQEQDKTIKIGSPIGNAQLYVLDSELGLQPIGVAGELCISGVGLARGYLNRPELTAERFIEFEVKVKVEDGEAPFGQISNAFGEGISHKKTQKNAKNKIFCGGSRGVVFSKRTPLAVGDKIYKTGDLARWLSDGNIQYLGRIDSQVKIRGFRIELQEIESQILKYEQVKEAVVLAKGEDIQDKYLCAYIVPVSITVEELKKHLSLRLPGYMVPGYFVPLEKLPLTTTGKVDQKALLKLKTSRAGLLSDYAAPGTSLEKQVAQAWKEVLQLETVGIHDNFFEIGGNSINILKVQAKLKKELNIEVPVVKLFKYPTIHTLSHYLDEEKEGKNTFDKELKISEDITRGKDRLKERVNISDKGTGLDIAVIGMAGVFPGAENIDEFWDNLRNSVESISFFSDEEMQAMGFSTQLLQDPDFVKAGGVIHGVEYFDVSFFDYTPREAAVIDPQVRVFHQCVWTALEDAAYDPSSYLHRIGLYAGSTPNISWEVLTMFSDAGLASSGFQAMPLRNKDFMCTRISYKLNLKGPSVNVQTACSTSLVAIHLACQGLLNGECELALAGGVTILYPQQTGYSYQEGMVTSPDGHCRAFDIDSKGVIPGSGAAVVVLKRLHEAVADRDHIYAVVKGTAINNDGFRKVGFTAPSVEGQAEVIRAAQYMAGIEPESITYVEAHGTGTELGDPVEIEALKMAFNTDKKKFCGIGSVKTNIGHLDTAAGGAGFIKTVLALKHHLIPPNLHFKAPNPKLGIEDSPFYVVSRQTEWEVQGHPRRAGVSSLGIGGTNAHIVLEESPIGPSSLAGSREQGAGSEKTYQLILLSAKTGTALERVIRNLANHFKKNPDINLADAAYTLQVGRKAFKYRAITTCSSAGEVIRHLFTPGSSELQFSVVQGEKPSVVFMFPGQGSQYVHMGQQLYEKEPVFREEMDRCFEILKPLLDYDIKEILYPAISPQSTQSTQSENFYNKTSAPSASFAVEINQTEITQPLIFIIEYALAKLLMHWGIKPTAMIGHSIGEYAAACLAGVFSLEHALMLVAYRGQLMQQLPGGAMLSISLPEEKLIPLLKLKKDLSLAAVNSSSLCVVSGTSAAVDRFESEIKKIGCKVRALHTSHGFHSRMMDPILNRFEEKVKSIPLNKPQLPYISNVSGSWLEAEEGVDPGYWARHLRHTVQFSRGLEVLLKEEKSVFVEVGPGRTLGIFLDQHKDKKNSHKKANIIRHPQENISDDYFLLKAIGKLWLYGVPLDWSEFYKGERVYRISLPTYPFEKTYCWVDEIRFKTLINQVIQAGQGESIEIHRPVQEPKLSPGIVPDRDDREYEAPRNELEEKVAGIWQGILGFEKISIHDNFFQLNGDSVSAMLFISQIKNLYGVEVPVKDFFENPTIEYLAKIIKKLLIEKIKNLSPEEKKRLSKK